MSTPTHLVLPNSDTSSLPSPQLHLLPFHTPFSGPAPISTYFLPRSTADTRESALPGSTLLLSAFRGRQLVGQHLHLPAGYEGVVLSVPEKKKSIKREEHEEEGGRRELTVKREEENEGVKEAEEEGGRRVSPRKRKVVDRFGGLPSKKPATGKVTKKFRIDSDSEDEDQDDRPQASTSTSSPTSAATTATGISIPTPLSPRPTLTNETSISSSSTSTPLPSTTETTVPSPPPSPPLQVINDRASRSPSPTPLSPTSQLQPQPTAQEEETEDADLLLPPPPPARELKILSSFGGNEGIVLWSADDPVDEGRDEYFRCLGKGGWMELAEVLHQEEEE